MVTMNRELLEPLRALNAAEAELRQGGLTAEQRENCERRVSQFRAQLPTALLGHHDRMAQQGRESVAPIMGSSCGACHLKLPVSQLAELHQPGRISVCPHCGVFLFNASAEPAASQA